VAGIVAVWVLLGLLAVANGAVRQGLYGPVMSPLHAHQVSTVVFIALMLAVIYGYVRLAGRDFSVGQLWAVGIIWTVLTVVFEFGMFHFVAGVAWGKLLYDYNLAAGRLWVLVLLTQLVAPFLLGRFAVRR